MKAVNLIPADARRAGAPAGRSGGLVYVLLGTLTLLVALAAMYGVATKATHDKKAELADVTARAAAAEQTARTLAGYTDFAAVRRARAQAVKTLADGRVDWAHVLHEVARTMPSNSWLTSMHAMSGGATAGTPAATPSSAAALTGAAAGAPSIELGGCTTAQSAMSGLMADLRRIDGVVRVRLTSSASAGTAAGAASASTAAAPGAGSAGPCAKPGRVTFALTLSFRAKTAPAAAAPATATAGSTP